MMKEKDEKTSLIGLAIGAAVMGLIASGKTINSYSITEELRRLGRKKGDGLEDEIFVKAAELVSKGL